MIYALADGVDVLDVEHMQAALALVDYSTRSARHLFGDQLGDKTADKILEALSARPDGMTRAEIGRVVFNCHKSKEVIARALAFLARRGLVEMEKRETGGRPATVWKLRARTKAGSELAKCKREAPPPGALPSDFTLLTLFTPNAVLAFVSSCIHVVFICIEFSTEQLYAS